MLKNQSMLIDLKSLPDGGEDYFFDQASEDFRGVLGDLIGKSPFEVKLRVETLGNSFQVSGHLQSHYTDSCSRCGRAIKVPIKSKINEILMIEEVRPRTTQSTHGQQSMDFSENQPSVTYLNSSQFDLSEFIHEMFAFSMQAYPKCEEGSGCAPVISSEDGQAGDKGHPAFSVLKKLKH